MINQYNDMLLQLAEARRVHSTVERMGTVYKVKADKSEQKIKLIIGKRPDGSDWYTPWLHTANHRGSHREEYKYHEGQNCVVHCTGGDFRMATITPYAENDKHKRPDNASDNVHTYQYAAHFKEHGPNYSRTHLAKGDQSGGGGGGGGGGGASRPLRHRLGARLGAGESVTGGGSSIAQGTSTGQGQDAKPVSFITIGSPTDPQNNGMEWSGPPPDKSGNVQQTVQHETKDPENEQKKANTTMTPDTIVHKVGETAAVTITKDNVTAMVGGKGGISPEMVSGLLGPMLGVIVGMIGQFASTQQVSAMGAAAQGVVAGQVSSGTQISAANVPNASAQIDNIFTNQVGSLLNPVMQADLTDATTTEVQMILGQNTTLDNNSAIIMAARLHNVISSSAGEALTDNEITHLSHIVANTIILSACSHAALTAQMDGTTPPTMPSLEKSPENMTVMAATLSEVMGDFVSGTSLITLSHKLANKLGASSIALPSSGGGGGGGGGIGGISSGLMSSMNSQLMSTINGLTGGTVVSLLTDKLDHLAQVQINQKSKQNILQQTMKQMTHKAANLFNLVGQPVKING